MKAAKLIERAARAYAAGSCLKAGQLIDQAYRRIGSSAVPKTLKRLDDKFERTCVKRSPSLNEVRYPVVRRIKSVKVRRR